MWKKLAVILKIGLGIAVKAEEMGIIKTKGAVGKINTVVEAGKAAAKK